jgi:hypothetical protein
MAAMTATPELRRGGCTCGAVRFEASGPPKWVAHCHCVNCRRAHGAGAVTWAGFEQARFRLLSGGEHLSTYLTETSAQRRFCGRCGSPLLFSSPRWPEEVHVAVAAFDGEGAPLLPRGHSYADRAPAWFPITDDLPQFGGASGTEPLERA